MTSRFTGSKVALAALAAIVSVGPQRVAGQAASPTQAYTPPRTANGQPDLGGMWQAVNSAAWNIKDHSPSLGVPGGFGVVEGGVLPSLPAALAKKKENFEKRTMADPEASCYLPGVPRATYLPFPIQIV